MFPTQNEVVNDTAFEREARQLIRQYESVCDAIEQSDVFKASGRTFTPMDAYNLCKQLDTYRQYENWHISENASAADLGILPKVATDLIATTYAISPAPLLASMQTIPEQQGIIYFKKVSASGMIQRFPYTTDSGADTNGLGAGFGPQERGELAPGDQLIDAKRGWVGDAMQYATEQVFGEDIKGLASSNSIEGQVKMFPIRGNVPVRIVGTAGNQVYEGTFMNRDGGHNDYGTLMTSDGWAKGTIKFSTGEINLEDVAVDFTGAGATLTISYMQDFETAADIPVIEMTLASTDVTAEVIAVAQNISTLKAYQFHQRFGRIAEDDALMDLVGVMADVEARRIVNGYVQMANWIERQSFSSGRPIEFAIQTPEGLSDYEYRQGFRYALVTADAEINLNCGRGAANRYIVGHKAGEFISALPKFEAAPANLAVGTHVLGYYDGKPVIRTRYMSGLRHGVNSKAGAGTAIDPSNAIIATYLNPQSPFDAPIVEATYMPVFVTNTMQFGHNPLQNRKAVATWKAFKNVVPHYVKAVSLV